MKQLLTASGRRKAKNAMHAKLHQMEKQQESKLAQKALISRTHEVLE